MPVHSWIGGRCFMSYRGRITFILVALFSLLLVPVYADTGESSQPAGSPIKRFFVHAYCHVFPCKSKPTNTESSTPAGPESSKPATAEAGTSTASAPTSLDTVAAGPATPPPAKEASAKSPTEEEGTVIGSTSKVIVLKPGEKPPERKHPEYEDWGTPYLPKTMKGDVHLLAKAEQGNFTRELVAVQWREMDPIDLWVIRPTGVKKPPVILYIYGFPTVNNQRYKDDAFCEALVKGGFAAIGFASALTGQRLHDRPGREWFVSELQESLGASVHDVQLILNYLASRQDLDMGRVGVWGVGSGASIAIIAAAVDPRIKALDLLNPWGDWPDWLAKSSLVPEEERHAYLEPGFLWRVKDLEPVQWLPQLKDREVRLELVLDGITVTPPEVRERMEAAAPPNAEVVHYQNVQEFAEKVDSAGKRFDWIRQQLGISGDVREANNPVSQGKTTRQP